MSLRDVILKKQENDSGKFESANAVVKARTVGVDYPNSPKVAGKEGFIWIAEFDMDGGYSQVLNVGVPDIINLPVLVYQYPKPPYIRQARGLDHSELISYDWPDVYTSDVGPHSSRHEWPDFTPGSDVMDVYPRSIATLRTYASSNLTVYVSYYRYAYQSDFKIFTGGYIDISSLVNTSPTTVTFVLIYFELETSTLGAVANTVSTTDVTGDQSDFWPDLPVGTIPSSVISVVSQTAVDETMITDVRDMLGSVQQANVSNALDIVADAYTELDGKISQVAVQAGPPERVRFWDELTQTFTNGVWITAAWTTTTLTIDQDSDGGFPLNGTWYNIQRGGDYKFHFTVHFNGTSSPGAVSSNIKIEMDLAINGVRIRDSMYSYFDPTKTTIKLAHSAYVPHLSRNDVVTVHMQYIDTLNATLSFGYVINMHIIGVAHNEGV